MALVNRRYHRPGNLIGIFPLPSRRRKPEKAKEDMGPGDQALMHEWADVLERRPEPQEWAQLLETGA
jgi:hypothetical protein